MLTGLFVTSGIVVTGDIGIGSLNGTLKATSGSLNMGGTNMSYINKLTVTQDLKVTGSITAARSNFNGIDCPSNIVVTGGSTFYGNMGITGATREEGIFIRRGRIEMDNGDFYMQSGNIYLVTGNVNSGGGFSTTSDRRYKKDVVEIEDALAKVKALRPVYYSWNDRESMNPSTQEIGFIAQEVEEVVPNVVLTRDNEEQTKSVAYDRLVSLLVAAVKEQSAVIAGLEARLAALESK